jgi:hypothetical protein
MVFAGWPDVNQRQHMADLVGLRLLLLLLVIFIPIQGSAALLRMAAAVREPAQDPGQKPVEKKATALKKPLTPAARLVQLTDQQLRDLFEVARVNRRSRKPGSTEPPATVDEWVTAFKHKRDEIVANRCTS